MRVPALLVQALCLGNLVILGGCATIVQGTRQDISISSEPTHAMVYVDRNQVGDTPLIVDMGRSRDHVVRIELQGYETFEAHIRHEASGWIAGNLALGPGVIAGFVVDVVTGSMYCLYPDQLHAILVKQGTTISEMEGKLYCAKVAHADPNWKKVGELTPSD